MVVVSGGNCGRALPVADGGAQQGAVGFHLPDPARTAAANQHLRILRAESTEAQPGVWQPGQSSAEWKVNQSTCVLL